MANKSALEAADQICRRIMRRDVPFGGIPFIGLGDFRQVAPVVKGQGPTPALEESVKSSYLWPHFCIHSLHRPIRSRQDPEYTDFVDRIGEDYQNTTASIDILRRLWSLDDAVQFLFPEEIIRAPMLAIKRSFLSPLNQHVDEFNSIIIQRLPGTESTSLQRIQGNVVADIH